MPTMDSRRDGPSSGTARNGSGSRLLKVPIVYHYVAHYREPVFATLIEKGKEAGIAYVIAADARPNIASIKVLDPVRFSATHEVQWTRLRNYWLPKSFLWQRGLVSYVWRERPDAVIFLGDFHFLSTWVASVVARLRRAKVFMWTHGFLRRERGLKSLARLAFYALAHGLLVYGHRAKAILEEKRFGADRVHVIYNSLDYRKQWAVRRDLLKRSPAEVRREIIGSDAGHVLVFSGRLEPFKGVDLLLRALARTDNGGPGVRLVCIGDGPARAELEGLARELGVHERVVFWGACYDESTLGKLFYLADLCVSPGPIGLLAVHSLMYGTPVLIGDDLDSHFPEVEAITIGSTGAMFRAGSVESLVSCIEDSLRRFRKPAVMQECFRAIDERYNPENQASIINDVITRAVRGDGIQRAGSGTTA